MIKKKIIESIHEPLDLAEIFYHSLSPEDLGDWFMYFSEKLSQVFGAPAASRGKCNK